MAEPARFRSRPGDRGRQVAERIADVVGPEPGRAGGPPGERFEAGVVEEEGTAVEEEQVGSRRGRGRPAGGGAGGGGQPEGEDEGGEGGEPAAVGNQAAARFTPIPRSRPSMLVARSGSPS